MTSTSGGDLVTVARPTLKRSQSLSSGEGVTVTTGGGEEGDRIYRYNLPEVQLLQFSKNGATSIV